YGMTLWGVLGAHYGWVNPLPAWKPGMAFDAWWAETKSGFDSVYREMLPAFRDLYGIDLNRITDNQARDLNRRIFDNYRSATWLTHVITERANIELMFIDPYWAGLDFRTAYPFGVLVFNVTSLVWGFHPTEFQQQFHPSQYNGKFDDPSLVASERGLPV